MSEREKQLEIILKQLLTQHFFGVELEWSHSEGFSLYYVNPELYIQIMSQVPEILKFHKERK